MSGSIWKISSAPTVTVSIIGEGTSLASWEDLNWFGKPTKGQVQTFCETEFDILLDFSHDVFDPLRFIMAITPAKFIIGSEKRNADLYDLLIQSKEEMSNMELLKNINHYTNQLSGKQS